MNTSKKLCPCHSQKPYVECCQRYHEGIPAESALLLMRSRYSAYALGLDDYIIQTTDHTFSSGSQDLAHWKKEILKFSKSTEFEGLQIIDFQEEIDTATVTFRAILKKNYQDISFTEKSFFIKMNNRWYYQPPLNLPSTS